MVLIVEPFLLGLPLISSRRLLLAGMLIGLLRTHGPIQLSRQFAAKSRCSNYEAWNVTDCTRLVTRFSFSPAAR